jgi:hypothetical protein
VLIVSLSVCVLQYPALLNKLLGIGQQGLLEPDFGSTSSGSRAIKAIETHQASVEKLLGRKHMAVASALVASVHITLAAYPQPVPRAPVFDGMCEEWRAPGSWPSLSLASGSALWTNGRSVHVVPSFARRVSVDSSSCGLCRGAFTHALFRSISEGVAVGVGDEGHWNERVLHDSERAAYNR